MPARTHLSRRLPVRLSGSHGLAAIWITLLIVLELAGRRGASDLADAIVVLFLGAAVGLTLLYHRQNPVPWVARLLRRGRRLGAWLRRHVIRVGFDFRGAPPIPPATPRILSVPPLALGAALAALAAATWWVSVDTRWLAHHGSFVLFALVMGTLWVTALALVAASLLLPLVIVHDWFLSRSRRPNGKRRAGLELVLGSAFLALTPLLCLTAPAWIAVAVLGLSLVLLPPFALLGLGREPVFLWRSRSGGPVASISSRRLLTVQALVWVLLQLVVAVATLGPHAAPGATGDPWVTPLVVTRLVGVITAWSGAVATATLALFGLLVLRALRAADPARRAQPTVHVSSWPDEASLARATQALTRAGLRLRRGPRPARPTDVCIALVPQEHSQAREFAERRWPWTISAADVERDEVTRILRRRDEMQCRRQLYRGLERVFKLARRKRFQRGTGFWVSPQYWFVHGLSRDQDEDEVELDDLALGGIIGPPYHLLFPQPARAHLHEVLTALEIDLVFVADGVRFQELRRVLGILFETHDIHAGRQRAEERHFVGLPRLRVVIDLFELGRDAEPKTFREPSYEDLGRARILFVFRDRDEREDPLAVPRDFSTLPAPLGLV